MPVKSHLSESPAYRKQRAELLQAEIALQDQIERVAAQRRGLPLDSIVDDYEFEEIPAPLAAGDSAPRRKPRLSQLFERPDQTALLLARSSPAPPCFGSAPTAARATSIR